MPRRYDHKKNILKDGEIAILSGVQGSVLRSPAFAGVAWWKIAAGEHSLVVRPSRHSLMPKIKKLRHGSRRSSKNVKHDNTSRI